MISCYVMAFSWYGGAMFFLGAGAMGEATVCGLAMILFTIFGIAFRKRR